MTSIYKPRYVPSADKNGYLIYNNLFYLLSAMRRFSVRRQQSSFNFASERRARVKWWAREDDPPARVSIEPLPSVAAVGGVFIQISMSLLRLLKSARKRQQRNRSVACIRSTTAVCQDILHA